MAVLYRHLAMLPRTLLFLLQAALVFAQSRQQLSLNSLSSFSSSSPPNPPIFTLPASSNLSVSVALCSGSLQSSLPQFFVTNDSSVTNPGPGDATEIQLNEGFGSWSGVASNGGVLAVQNIGQAAFEIGIADNGPMHELLPTYPLLGDSTSNQVLLFSPPFASAPPITQPSYPNYTLPPANLSIPSPPSSTPNFTLVLTPSSASLSSLPQTGCSLRSAPGQTASVQQQSVWLRDEHGWRTQWLMGDLNPSTNYTAYVIQNGTKVSGPMYFATKSAAFACPLVHSLPYCPSISYAVPLPEPPFPYPAYDSTTLPSNTTAPLLEYMTNFTTTLLSFACGRDIYSPLQSCADCQHAYRKWLCSVSFTRCGEQAPGSPPPTQTAQQQPFSALVPQAPARSMILPNISNTYTALLPCLETCTAVDRACPIFLGFKCPVVRFNAAASYGVGYIDSGEEGVQGQGSTGVMQDRWGNVWCNGS